MHKQSIINTIIDALDTTDCKVVNVSLTVDEANLKSRLLADVENGIRSADMIDRSITRIGMYQNLNTVKIDTNGKSIS